MAQIVDDFRRVGVQLVKPNQRNPRTHSKKQLRQLRKSVQKNGVIAPLLVDENLHVIAGNARLAVAQEVGWKDVPVYVIRGLSETQKRSLAIADNRIAENAGWDQELLTKEIELIIENDAEFDCEVIGFEDCEIDILFSDTSQPDTAADRLPNINRTPISRTDDVFRLGEHRLVCGDATKSKSYSVLMGSTKAALVFTDPPYNVPIENNVTGNGRVQHGNFQQASGEMSPDEFVDFLSTFLGRTRRQLIKGTVLFLCMDWRHLRELLEAADIVGIGLLNHCIWVKSNGGMGSLYRSRHEHVLVFKHGNAPHINNVELGKHGRNRTNVWEYAGASSLKSDAREGLAVHPTVKPVDLVADALLDCSNRGDIVLDPFMGSGTTIMAAERTRRIAYGLEIDPLYIDVSIRRWQAYTGDQAIHIRSGLTFDQLTEKRQSELDQDKGSNHPEGLTAEKEEQRA